MMSVVDARVGRDPSVSFPFLIGSLEAAPQLSLALSSVSAPGRQPSPPRLPAPLSLPLLLLERLVLDRLRRASSYASYAPFSPFRCSFCRACVLSFFLAHNYLL